MLKYQIVLCLMRQDIYTFNAYVLGNPRKECAFVEFAPRKGRNNYRISRQNIKYKHPAWSIENGFPEPNKGSNGEYTSEGDFAGIIDNLIIIIIRTNYRSYYAGFLNEFTIPADWPQNIGLEKIFEGERRDVINMDAYKLQFINNASNPFGDFFTKIEENHRKATGCNILLYGVPGSGKSWTIEHEYCKPESVVERVVFHPDYSHADFIGQILPAVSEDGQVSYKFTPGPFTSILRDAYNNPQTEYILIIEEINRGNAPAIFGDVFQLLDRSKENGQYPMGTSEYGITNANIAKEVYGNDKKEKKVRIPSNLSIIGTMNTSDQNVFTLDTAFQRRWEMRLVENNFDNVDSKFAEAEILDTGVSWRTFCEEINKLVIGNNVGMTSAEDKRLGAYFINPKELIVEEGMDNIDDYKELCKKKRNGETNPTEDEKLKHIRHAVRQNSKFPEKVIKYLWDDVFKYNRDIIFDTTEYKSLEQVIYAFVVSRDSDRFNIFKDDVKSAITGSVE